MSAGPLYRNRDFMLLQAGQLLSTLGTQSMVVAYPLLVLALTGSPAKAGIVGFARFLPHALLAIPAGLAADRWNRKAMMIGGDVLRAAAVGGLAVAIVSGDATFWMIAAVALVEGVGGAVFGAASPGALRGLVPTKQLPDAVAVQTGRRSAVALAAPPLGGALFGIGRAIPFVVDAISYVFSTLAIAAIRKPFQQERERDTDSLRTRLLAGFRFMWSHRFLRTTAFLFGLTNFIGPGVVLALVVIAKGEGLSPAAVGALAATFAVGLVLGSLASPLVRRLLPVHTVLILEFWAWLGCAAFLIWPSPYVLAASMIPVALAIPANDAVVHGYAIAMTPDHLLGRLEGVRSTIALASAPFGPLVAGVLLDATSPRVTIAVFVVFALVLAVWAAVSPAIRDAPTLDELEELPAPAS